MEETEELRELLHLNLSKEERKVLFDKIEFNMPPRGLCLIIKQKEWMKIRSIRDVYSENKKGNKELAQNQQIQFYQERLLIEKYLLPIYFRHSNENYDIHYHIKVREKLLKHNLLFNEARKLAKQEEPYDQLPKEKKQLFSRISIMNSVMVKNASIEPFLTPYEYYELQEKKNNKRQNKIKIELINKQWKQLTDEAKQKYRVLAHSTNKNRYRMGLIYKLTHLSEMKEILIKRNYLQIYIDTLYYDSLDVKPIKYTELEVVNDFENLDANIRMKYIRKAHKEDLIHKYILYKIKDINKTKQKNKMNDNVNKFCSNKNYSVKSLRQLLSEEEMKVFYRQGWKPLIDVITNFKEVIKPTLNKKLKLKEFCTKSNLPYNINLNKTFVKCTNEEKEIILEMHNREKEVYERKKKHFEVFGYCYNIDALNKKGLENEMNCDKENNEQTKSMTNTVIDKDEDDGDNDKGEHKDILPNGNDTY